MAFTRRFNQVSGAPPASPLLGNPLLPSISSRQPAPGPNLSPQIPTLLIQGGTSWVCFCTFFPPPLSQCPLSWFSLLFPCACFSLSVPSGLHSTLRILPPAQLLTGSLLRYPFLGRVSFSQSPAKQGLFFSMGPFAGLRPCSVNHSRLHLPLACMPLEGRFWISDIHHHVPQHLAQDQTCG